MVAPSLARRTTLRMQGSVEEAPLPLMKAVVPPGFGPGHPLLVDVNGKTFTVDIPMGKQPGDTFEFMVNANAAPSRPTPSNAFLPPGERRMCQALPFLQAPAHLDGTLPGDRGFDPFGFGSNREAMFTQREAELKHGRLAMLAMVGWPAAEILHTDFASMMKKPSLLALNGRAPSVLNGGLDKVVLGYWVLILVGSAWVEGTSQLKRERQLTKMRNGEFWNPGDLGFDPLNLYSQYNAEAEIKHGRVAMVAITFIALQEFVTGKSVFH